MGRTWAWLGFYRIHSISTYWSLSLSWAQHWEVKAPRAPGQLQSNEQDLACAIFSFLSLQRESRKASQRRGYWSTPPKEIHYVEVWGGCQMPSPQQEQGHGDLINFDQERTFWHGSNIHKMDIKSSPSGLGCSSLIHGSQGSKASSDLFQKRDPR